MARLGVPLEGARRASLQRAYYTRTWRGIVIAQTQDRSARKRKSKAWQQSIDRLRASMWAIRYYDPGAVAEIMDATRGTQILWRDLLTAWMAGTVVTVRTEDGRTLYPVRYRRLVERALDVLDMHPVGLLVRAGDRWRILPPGPAGTVLTSGGPGQPLGWR